jgi:hypothetical protein
MLICRVFANIRNLQKTIVLPSHGRGHEFESRRVHYLNPLVCLGPDPEVSCDYEGSMYRLDGGRCIGFFSHQKPPAPPSLLRVRVERHPLPPVGFGLQPPKPVNAGSCLGVHGCA